MTAMHLSLGYARSIGRFLAGKETDFHAARDRAAARAAPAPLLRKPSRRIVAELSSALAVSPIVLGLAVLAANPWPERASAPASPSPTRAFGALASLTHEEIGAALARARQGAKLAERAPAIKISAPRHSDAASLARSAPPEASEVSQAGVARATIAEDGSLIVNGEKVRLEGIVLPDTDASCRRLDGVEVRCLERVAARLSIIAQQGRLRCRTSIDASGDRVGSCAVGKIDLAQDLLHARLARPARAKPDGQGA
ncbi:MAG: hypothetical protein KF904_03715 [Rhodoblastus sp.]|nr:hypothetical protein [Rhodoblastus sp.]